MAFTFIRNESVMSDIVLHSLKRRFLQEVYLIFFKYIKFTQLIKKKFTINNDYRKLVPERSVYMQACCIENVV